MSRSSRGKPPAKMDGLVQFINDFSIVFTEDEQRTVLASDAGQALGRAVTRCESHSKMLREARAKLRDAERETDPSPMGTDELKRAIYRSSDVYADCLAYMVCPDRWKCYKSCWDVNVGQLTSAEVQSWQQQGALEIVCRSERESLERGIGAAVSLAVKAGDVDC